MEPEFRTEFSKAFIKNKKLVLEFNIGRIDKKTKKFLSESVKNSLKKEEREFFTYTFDDKKIDYTFNAEKWIKKSLTNKFIETPDRYEKKIKIGKIPSIISANISPVIYEPIINGSFRNYIEKNSVLRNKIFKLMPSSEGKKTLSFFSIKYDAHTSSMNIILKPELRINPLILFKLDKKNKQVKKNNFDKQVLNICASLRRRS